MEKHIALLRGDVKNLMIEDLMYILLQEYQDLIKVLLNL